MPRDGRGIAGAESRVICVFCGSRSGTHPAYARAADALGHLIADAGHTLVYGGGSVGLMGRVADAALARGGRVIGVIPEVMVIKEVAHRGGVEQHLVGSMHERKQRMASLADAFIAMPGGFGTFEELFEMITWNQLGIHAKPIGLLNVEGFFDSVLDLVRHATREGFIPEASGRFLVASDSPADLLDAVLHRPIPASPAGGLRRDEA